MIRDDVEAGLRQGLQDVAALLVKQLDAAFGGSADDRRKALERFDAGLSNLVALGAEVEKRFQQRFGA